MEAIIAVCIAVVGWLTNHLLSIRAQQRNHLTQLRSAALSEIGLAIRRYQDWLSEVRGVLTSLSLGLKYRVKKPEPMDWLAKHRDFMKLAFEDRRQMDWGYLLEEYEILFMKVTEVRKRVVERHGDICVHLSNLSSMVVDAPLDESKLIQFLEDQGSVIEEAIWDQHCLTWDLRVYLQNLYLAPLTGDKREVRIPLDDRYPRIIEDEKGLPTLVPGKSRISPKE